MNKTRNIHRFFIAVCLVLTAPQIQAATGMAYHGRITKADGTPLESNPVQFLLQIRTPGTENCLLYQETKSINMTGSKGLFGLVLNDGTGTRTDTSGYTFEQIFANYGSYTFAGADCSSGTTYAPSAGDGRRIQVYFKDASLAGWEALTAQILNAVPSAVEASQVTGFPGASLLRVADASLGPQSVAALTPANFTELLALINGTSTRYLKNSATGAVIPSVASNPASPVAGQVWYDSTTNQMKFYNGSVQTIGSGGGSGTVTSIVASTGLSGGTITTTGTIGISAGGVGTTELADGGVTAAKLSGSGMTSGQFLKYGGTWAGASINLTDLKSSITPFPTLFNLTTACTAARTLTYDSVTDRFVCADAALDGGQITGGTIAAARLPAGASVWNVSGSDISYSAGNVGVGTASPTRRLDVQNTLTAASGWSPSISYYTGVYPGATSSITAIGVFNAIGNAGSTSDFTSGNIWGAQNEATHGGTQTLGTLVASYNDAVVNSTGTVNAASGVTSIVDNGASGTINNAYAYRAQITNAGTMTNSYGLYIDTLAGTNKWGVYQSDATNKNYFAGSVGIGTNSPWTKLHIESTAGSSNTVTLHRNANTDQNMIMMQGSAALSTSKPSWYAGMEAGSDDFRITTWDGTTSSTRLSILANGNMGVGTTSPQAALDVVGATTKSAIIVPRDTVANRPTSPVNGMIRYASDTNALEGYINGSWQSLASTASQSITGNVAVGGTLTSTGAATFNGGATVAGGALAMSSQNITGVGSNVTGSGALTVAAGGTNQALNLASTGTAAVNLNTGSGPGLAILDTGGTNVNYLAISGAATGNKPTIAAKGSDANVGIAITPQGTGNTVFTSGNVGIGNASPAAALDVSANVTTSDAIRATFSSSVTALNSDWGGLDIYNTNTTAGNNGAIYFSTKETGGTMRSPAYIAAVFPSHANGGTTADLAFGTGTGNSVLERMRILNSGNVGIGTSAPDSKLHVVETKTNTAFALIDAANVNMTVNPSGNSDAIFRAMESGVYTHGSYNFTAGTTALANKDSHYGTGTKAFAFGMTNVAANENTGTINDAEGIQNQVLNLAAGNMIGATGISNSVVNGAGGNVTAAFGENLSITNSGAGTITDARGLQIVINKPSGTITTGTGIYIGNIQATNKYGLVQTDSAANNYFMGNVGIGTTSPGVTYKLDVQGGGVNTSGVYTNVSDIRMKKDIHPLSSSLERILNLESVSYLWKDSKNDPSRQVGFIAQQVEKFIPEVVRTDERGFKSMSYSQLVSPVVSALQEFYHRWAADSAETRRQMENLKNENAVMRSYLCQRDPNAPFCH